jgi:hypothetical protein
MSLDQYNHFKNKFDNTAPIRGRATEIKPIGQRRRDWEQVVKRWAVEDGALDMEGEWSYGAHLYRTDCVMYMPNGDVHVRTGGWDTPTTADFISRYLPHSMRCYKKYNKIWVDYQSQNYPIDTTVATIFRFNKETDTYAVTDAKPMLQKVIDRTKIKEARDKLEGFRNYAKIMLKLADGWIGEEIVDQHAEPVNGNRDYWGRRSYKIGDKVFNSYNLSGSLGKSDAERIYTAMCTEDDTQYPKLLCMICAGSNSLESRVVRTDIEDYTDRHGNSQQRQNTVREYQYDYKTVDNRINFVIKQGCDVYTTKEVPVGKVVTNLV